MMFSELGRASRVRLGGAVHRLAAGGHPLLGHELGGGGQVIHISPYAPNFTNEICQAVLATGDCAW